MKRKDFLRKCLAVLCSGVLLAAMAVFPPAARAAAASGTLHLTIEGESAPIYEDDVAFTRGETLDKIMEAALDARHIGYDIANYSYGLYVNKIDSQPTDGGWWNYYVNDGYCDAGIGSFTPKDGDTVTFFVTSYPMLSFEGGSPTAGRAFSVTIRKASVDPQTFGAAYAPAAGASVQFGGHTYTTDENGQVSGLTASAGTYALAVSGAGMPSRTFAVTVTQTAASRQTIGVADTQRTLDLTGSTNVTSLVTLGDKTSYIRTDGHVIPAGFHIAAENGNHTVAYLDFPSATTVAGSGWGGVLALPHAVSVTVGEVSAAAVAVGGSTALSLSEPVRLTLPGASGKCAGYVDEGGVFHTMPKLSADALGSGPDGYYDDGADLIVWTRHFSSFVTYSGALAVSEASVAATIDGAGAWLTANSPASDWSLFALARAGKTLPVDYAAMAKAEMDENDGSFGSPTDLEKAILFLRAAGVDPTDFYGVDLVGRLCADSTLASDGLSAQIYGLLALDSADAALPAGSPVNALIARVLSYQKSDGAFALAADQDSDPDLTAMALTALAPHRDQAAVQTAVDKALAYLSAAQQNDGGFIPASSTAESSESAAQAVIALSALKLDPQSYAPLLKTVAGVTHSALDNLLTFKSADGGFLHQTGGTADSMATQQALMALTAYRNYRSGAAALYDLSGVPVRALSAGGSTTDPSVSATADDTAGTVANPKTGGGKNPAPAAVVVVTGLTVCLLARRKLRRGL